MEPESRAPRRGRTDPRQGQQVPAAAQNLCPGPSREWGLPTPYSSGDMGTSPPQGGAALGNGKPRRHHTLTPPWSWISKPGPPGSVARAIGKGEAWPHARLGIWPLWVAKGFSGCWGMSGCQWPILHGKQDAAQHPQLSQAAASPKEQGGSPWGTGITSTEQKVTSAAP